MQHEFGFKTALGWVESPKGRFYDRPLQLNRESFPLINLASS